MLGFSQRPIQPAGKRLRHWLLGRLSNRPPRSQRVYVVTINGHRFKRVVCPDSQRACAFADALTVFAPDEIYPAPLLLSENVLWVEYIEGEKIEHVDEETVLQLARLFAVIYKRDARRVAARDTSFNHAIHVDLRFLRQVGVLDQARYRDLDGRVDAMTPEELWLGYDCSDAVLKNFVRCPDGSIRGVDVESLTRDQLLGTGVAKAGVRWLGDHRARFLDEIALASTPDFQSYWPFVELSFLAHWVKSSFLEKKRRFVDPQLFDRFLDSGAR